MSVEERLRAVMAAPLASLVALDRRERPAASVVERWDLPEKDRAALADWGLPTDLLMRPVIQDAAEPLLAPNVAGERERRLIDAGQRLYQLGWWGRHDLTPKIGAVASDGRVLGLRDAPVTAADLPPALREVYADLYHPAVTFLNSSIAQFVDIAWRWHAAVAILREFQLQEPDFARIEACERIVLDGVEAIDPAIDADDPEALWVAIITD